MPKYDNNRTEKKCDFLLGWSPSAKFYAFSKQNSKLIIFIEVTFHITKILRYLVHVGCPKKPIIPFTEPMNCSEQVCIITCKQGYAMVNGDSSGGTISCNNSQWLPKPLPICVKFEKASGTNQGSSHHSQNPIKVAVTTQSLMDTTKNSDVLGNVIRKNVEQRREQSFNPLEKSVLLTSILVHVKEKDHSDAQATRTKTLNEFENTSLGPGINSGSPGRQPTKHNWPESGLDAEATTLTTNQLTTVLPPDKINDGAVAPKVESNIWVSLGVPIAVIGFLTCLAIRFLVHAVTKIRTGEYGRYVHTIVFLVSRMSLKQNTFLRVDKTSPAEAPAPIGLGRQIPERIFNSS